MIISRGWSLRRFNPVGVKICWFERLFIASFRHFLFLPIVVTDLSLPITYCEFRQRLKPPPVHSHWWNLLVWATVHCLLSPFSFSTNCYYRFVITDHVLWISAEVEASAGSFPLVKSVGLSDCSLPPFASFLFYQLLLPIYYYRFIITDHVLWISAEVEASAGSSPLVKSVGLSNCLPLECRPVICSWGLKSVLAVPFPISCQSNHIKKFIKIVWWNWNQQLKTVDTIGNY